MISYEDALSSLLSAVSPLGSSVVPLEDCSGRHAAADVFSPIDLPPFDNSSMDGYAVRSGDVLQVPATLRQVGEVAAGGILPVPINAGECARIFTGAPIPAGADAVVMQEDTSLDPAGNVIVRDRVGPWENIRFRGEDVRRGALLLSAGARLGPAQVAVLAAAGIAAVSVHRPLRVAVVVSGDELRPPGVPLGPGQIYESNSSTLASLVRGIGAAVTVKPVVTDDINLTSDALLAAFLDADVVLTAGGASVGDHDVIRPAFERIGGEIDFWKVAIRPGKPFFHGRLGDKFLFGVPGNPVSAFVTAVLLVLPALRRLQGDPDPMPKTEAGVLAEVLSNPGNRRHFVRVATARDGSVRPAGVQASHILSSLAVADGLVDVPPGCQLPAGSPVRVIRW